MAVARAVEDLNSTLTRSLREAKTVQATTDSTIEHLWHKVIDQELDLTRAVDQVAQLCSLLAERMQVERLERSRFADALELLAHRLVESPSNLAAPRVIGGSVFAAPPTRTDDEVVLVDDIAPRPPVERPSGAGGDQRVPRQHGWREAR